MEGSRHERAALITATYIIGFATAFIAFGVSQLERGVEFVYVPEASQPASVASAGLETAAGTLSLRNDGLYYVTSLGEVLISALTDGGGEDGLAAVITQYELSPDGIFAYFCEQPTADSSACKPFVYAIDAAVVYPLTQHGERIAVDGAVSLLRWDEGGVASIGEVDVDSLPR